MIDGYELRKTAQGTICTYRWDSISQVYSCLIEQQTFEDDENMLPVIGTHLPGFGSENVTQLSTSQSRILVFPSPVVDYFRNMRNVYLRTSMNSFNRPITNCEHLELIVLDGNNFPTFGGGIFGNCARVTEISLFSASIVEISDNAFVGLSGVEHAILSFNKIISLNSRIFEPLSSLKRLQLDWNNIEHLSAGIFSPSPFLESLILHDNNISSWHSTILTNTRLTNLDLSGNPINRLEANAFENLPSLESLRIGSRNFDDGLTEIPVFTGLAQLRTLRFSGNIITHVSADSFQNLINLRHLDLGSSGIETVDFKAGPNRNLGRIERLSLWNNRIRNIQDDSFTALVNLKELDIGSNYLERLSGRSIRPIHQLRRLQVSSNRMQSIRWSLFDEVTELEFVSYGNCFNGEVHINNTVDTTDFVQRVVPMLRPCFNLAANTKNDVILLITLLSIVGLFWN
ncbi:Toll-like receptor Tollo [Pseudolycoriella hygida]|uniref:Toll-like receptor Tollo n=1 Tax=Pseudolycoriella hygida TaxID=35572 RepID=A0A9Q0N7K9_9DIPT|nr:Toll-like receptor Tollo [Pseudolycoriella hygida]